MLSMSSHVSSSPLSGHNNNSVTDLTEFILGDYTAAPLRYSTIQLLYEGDNVGLHARRTVSQLQMQFTCGFRLPCSIPGWRYEASSSYQLSLRISRHRPPPHTFANYKRFRIACQSTQFYGSKCLRWLPWFAGQHDKLM